MPGRGPAPKEHRQRARDEKQRGRGTWRATDGVGWQHGQIPVPPDGLKAETLKAWSVWMRSWFAANWSPDDLPGLETTILLYDQVRREEYQRATELRLSMDNYGITPKGQQDRRWTKPKPEETQPSQSQRRPVGGQYVHLKVVNE